MQQRSTTTTAIRRGTALAKWLTIAALVGSIGSAPTGVWADSENFEPGGPNPPGVVIPPGAVPLEARITPGLPSEWGWFWTAPEVASMEHAFMAEAPVAVPTWLPVAVPVQALEVKGMALMGEPVAVKRRMGEVEIIYPPPYPTELFCDAQSVAIWHLLRPEIMPDSAVRAHLLAIGELAYYALERTINNDLRNWAIREIGKTPLDPPDPPLQFGPDPRSRAMIRLAAMELVGGHPYSMDPTFCRRLLAVGVEAVPAIVACTRSDHKLLRRNATALLGAFPAEMVRDRLQQLATDADRVVAVRAVRGLAQHRNPANAELFFSLITGDRAELRSAALHAVAQISHPATLDRLRPILAHAIQMNDRDRLWDLLPAIARIGGQNAEIARMLSRWLPQLRLGFPGGPIPQDPGFRNPEPANHHKRVLAQLAELALVNLGDEPAKTHVLRMAAPTDVFRANWFVYIDTLQRIDDDEARRKLTEFFEAPAVVEPAVKIRLLHALAQRPTNWEWMTAVIETHGDFAIRAQALSAMARRDGSAAMRVVQALIGPMIRMLQTTNPRQFLQFYQAYAPLVEIANTPGALRDDRVARRYRQLRTEFAARHLPLTTQPIFRWLPMIHAVIVVGTAVRALDFDQLAIVTRWAAMAGLHALRFNHAVAVEPPPAPSASQAALDAPPGPTFVIELVPPILESAIDQLNRVADPRAVPLLIELLGHGHPYGGPEAALALTKFPFRSVAAALIEALNADDGLIRLCAYRTLKQISERDHWADWLFAPDRVRKSATDAYRTWLDSAFR